MFPTDLPPSCKQLHEAPHLDKLIGAETSESQAATSHSFSFGTSNSSNALQATSSSTVHITQRIEPSPYTPNEILKTKDDIFFFSKRATVWPIRGFNAEMDAKFLEIAMKSGLSRDQLIKLLCHRSTIQRQQILIEYRKKFLRDLVVIFQEKYFFIDNFGIVLQSLVQTPINYLLTEVHYAVINDSFYLSDLLFYLSNDEMKKLKIDYGLKHMITLSNSIDKYIARGTFQHVLKLIVEGKRDETNPDVVSNYLVMEDLKPFQTPSDYLTRYDQNNTKLCNMFATRNWKHIKAVADAFERSEEYSLEKLIKANFAVNLAHLYCGIIRYANNKHLYFAKCLKRCMKGLETKNRILIRIIVSRCEIDLNTIKNRFYYLTNKSLKSWIKANTSGFYKYMLYELINEPVTFENRNLPKGRHPICCATN